MAPEEPLVVTSPHRSSLAPPAHNPNLGFQPQTTGPKYNYQESLGSDVPAPVVAEDPQDDLMDEEDEDQDNFGWGIFAFLHKTFGAIFGGLTCGLMLIVLLGVSLYCVIATALADAAQPPYVIMAVYLAMAVAMLDGLLIIRFFVNKIIVGLFFPESRVASFIVNAGDPEFWTLVWCITLWGLWRASVTPSAGDGDGWVIDWLPDHWSYQEISDSHQSTYRYTLVFLLLWAIRDTCVKLVMLKLMLGFLMNFNDEVVKFLHKYALLRRLNAAWIRLIPSAISEMRENSTTTLATTTGGGGSNHPAPNTVANSAAIQAQMNMARTAAMLRREGSKMQLMDAVRLREDSKQRFRDGKEPSKMSLLRNSSKLKGSLIKDEDSPPERISIRVEAAAEDVIHPALTRRAMPDFTPARKRQREREFHVETTGRSLPRLLEKSNISAITKSKVLNMVSVLWIRTAPVVLFVDGQRTELTSKQIARQVGTTLFESLLTFRLSVAAFEEELQAEEEAAREPSNLARILQQSNRNMRTSMMTSDGRESLTGRVEWADMRRQSAELQLTEAAAHLVDIEPAPVVLPAPGDGPPPPPQLTPEPLHRAPPPPRSDDSDELITPREVGINSAKAFPTPQSQVDSSDGRHKWFRKRRQSAQGGVTPDARTPMSGMSSSYHNVAGLARGGGGVVTNSTAIRGENNKVLNEAQLAAITAAEIKKVKLLMPDDNDCLTQDFFELFMPTSDAKDLMELLDPGKLGKITSKMFLRGVVNLYRLRKQMVNSLEAQEEIENTFRRVCVYMMTFLCLLVFLIFIGVDANTIIVSGAAVLTAVSLVLSFVYTDFIQSIILIVFLNPYRIGDRVRIDGEAQYVKRITTYFTEFESLHGRVQYISHKELSNKLLINESRCKVATTEIAVLFSEKTTPSQYNALKRVLDAYLKSRPLEWIGDSLFMFIQGIGPSQFIEVSIWATHTESWGNWMAVRTQESSFFHFIMRQASVLGMYYRLPIQRWEPYLQGSSALVPTTYGGVSPAPRPSSARAISVPQQRDTQHPVFEAAPSHSRAYGEGAGPWTCNNKSPPAMQDDTSERCATELPSSPPVDENDEPFWNGDLLGMGEEEEWRIERLEDLREQWSHCPTLRYRRCS